MANTILLKGNLSKDLNSFKLLIGVYLLNRTYTFYLLTLLLVGSLSSCNSKLNQENYIKWVRDYDNKAHVNIVDSNFIFDLQYQPTEYVLLQRGSKNSGEARTQELKDLSGVQYYTLTISTKDRIDLVNYDANTTAEKKEKLYYFSYQFQNDITIEEDGKVLPCILYHAERPADLDGGRTFVLGFENPNANSATSEIVIRSDLFSASPVKIKVAKSNIPKLIYD